MKKKFITNFFYFLQKENYLYGQILFLIVLGLFSSFTLFGVQLYKNALYGDRLNFYSFFYDILHSLNYFGEIPWWNPSAQNGLPQYYPSILGLNYINPVFVSIAVIVWALGLINIHVVLFVKLFAVYVGVLIPLLFLLGLLLLARQIFKNNLVIAFILIVGSFSLGLVYNVRDLGLEPTAYALFFAAAFLKFLKEPNKGTFLKLSLSVMVLAVTLNYQTLFWNTIFIPTFVILVIIFNPYRQKINIPKIYWVILIFLTVICTLPSLFTLSQGKNIVRVDRDERIIEYYRLRPGNPLELLTVSTPGIAYGRSGEKQKEYRHPVDFQKQNPVYYYLGILTLPLIFVGLIFGRRIWKYVFFTLLAISSLIICLSGYSPIFSLILILKTPLRVMGHYNYAFFILGTSCLLILTAALGLEAVLRYKQKFLYKIFIASFSIFSILSILFYIHINKEPFAHPIFGFGLVMLFFYTIIFIWLLNNKNPKKEKHIFVLLLIFTLIDVSTCAFWYVREKVWLPIWENNLTNLKDPPIESIGIPPNDPRSWYTKYYLGLATTLNAQKMEVNVNSFPLLAFYTPTIKLGISKGNGFEQIKTLQQYEEDDKLQPIKFYFADLDGDKKPDIQFYDSSGDIWGSLYTAKGYTKHQKLLHPDSLGVLRFGDVNGDGLSDAIYLDIQGNLTVALSSGNSFLPFSKQLQLHPYWHKLINTADMNGDGKQDFFYYDKEYGDIWVSFSTDAGFSTPQKCFKIEKEKLAIDTVTTNVDQIRLADVNGDNKTDLLLIDLPGKILVSLSNGESFAEQQTWLQLAPFCVSEQVKFEDVNGDRKADAIYIDSAGKIWVCLSTGNGFSKPAKWLQYTETTLEQIQFSDVNGDGKKDILICDFFSGQKDIKITERTYNTIRLEVTTPKKSLLFYRDAYSPYWHSTVNGKATKIEKMFLGFKGVVVDAGKSEVVFNFSPPFIKFTLILSYSIILLTLLFWIYILKRRSNENQNY